MKRKGFTLIELLAVIVILAIIALIATPIVLNMIDSARKSAAKASALGYIEAIEYNNYFAELGTDANLPETYTKVTGTKQVSELSNIKMKGKRPESGSVTIDTNGKVSGATLCVNGYTVTYATNDVTDVTKGCSGSSSSEPEYVYTTYVDGENEDGVITQASQGHTERPIDKFVYLRYTLKDGEIDPETPAEPCLYIESKGGELCLNYDTYDNVSDTILDFYKWDDSLGSSTYDDVTCDINDSRVLCYDANDVSAQVSKWVNGIDYSISVGYDWTLCSIDKESFECYHGT